MENSIENVKSQAWEFLEKCKINKLSMNLLDLNNLNLGFKILSYSEGKEYIETFNLIEYSKNHRGFTTCFNGDMFIFYDNSLTSSERNFTIAHEIGHIVLWHTSNNNILGKSNDETIQNQQEKESDVFAYSLLAPAPVLLKMKVYSPYEISRLTGLNLKNSQTASTEVVNEEMFKGKGIDERLVRLFDNYINNYLKYNEEQYIRNQEQHIKEQEQLIKEQKQYIKSQEQRIKEQEQLTKSKLSKMKYICICICSIFIIGSFIMYFLILQNIKTNNSIENTNISPNPIIQNNTTEVGDIDTQDLHNNIENQNFETIENVENETPNSPLEDFSSKIVFITPTGKKYHRESCRYVNRNSIEVPIEQAKELNLLPCNSCNPDD